MTSSIFFKFKSQKDSQRVTFDGPGISVFEVKREIINISHLGDGTDFDLAIYNEDTNDEYDDDTTVIPRSTSVVARRLPARVRGAGRAARYVSGKMPITAKNQHRREAQHTRQGSEGISASNTNGALDMSNAQTEEERIKAMFAADASSWEQQKEQMANAKPVFRGAGRGKPVNIPDRPPPPGYICYRCQEKGHWIQACPTNDDPEFDKKPRLRRTTGIPKSFQRTVEKPIANAVNDGLTDDTKQNSNVMVNAEGEFVIAVPDHQSFQKFQDKAKASAAHKEEAASGSKELQERGLECSLDKRMFIEPMKTPCCGQTYCNDCIENALINNDFVCPNCQTEGVLIDNLEPDDEMVKKIKVYEDEKMIERREKERSKTPPKAAASTGTPQDSTKLASPRAESKSPKKEENSPQPIGDKEKAVPMAKQLSTDSATSKKRPAEEDLENNRTPMAPGSVRDQTSTPSASTSTSTPSLPAAPKTQQDFINQMNAMSAQMGGQVPNGNMPFPMPNMNAMNPMGFPNPMMAMSMAGMMGMNPAMMNPMMMPQQNGWPGMNGMNGMGFPQPNAMFTNNNHNNTNGMGFPPQPNGWNQNWPMSNNGMGNGPGNQYQQNQRNGWQGQGQGQMSNNTNGIGRGTNASFPNQQRAAGGDEDAYFRKPVNPHRHQNRQKRVRPSDYTEL
ncbi:MAG: hypothetical protein M1822_001187 [Bathelium mastoideum]|nr:MAG: hypothetical protein M1822_001187 [Bathelium mastoideum]